MNSPLSLEETTKLFEDFINQKSSYSKRAKSAFINRLRKGGFILRKIIKFGVFVTSDDRLWVEGQKGFKGGIWYYSISFYNNGDLISAPELEKIVK